MTISRDKPSEEDKTMANLATTKTNEISLAGAQTLVASVKDGLALVNKGYLAIAPDVTKLYDCKGYKALGYKNFDEMCALEFGMSHGTTVGIRKVFAKFGSVSKENKYTIPDKYAEYGYTKLLLMTDKKFEDAGINPIETFTPEMTITEMKDALKAKLEDKAEKQDESAIESTATIKDDIEKSIIDNSEDVNEVAEDVEASPIDRANEIIELVKQLQSEVNLKPEKMALFDAVLANMKEIKKLIK